MYEDKSTQSIGQPDVNQFYTTINDYIKYCIRNLKTNSFDKENEGLLAREMTKKEEALETVDQQYEEQSKNFQKMCKTIEKGGIPYLSVYVEALGRLYENNRDWKREIKIVLVSDRSLKLFRDSRSNIMDLYPVLEMVNKIFPVDDYSELSLSPKAAIYGSEVNKTKKGSIKKPPFKNEEIQAMLELFLRKKEYERFGDWIMAILVFAPEQLVDGYQEKFIPERKRLMDWVYKQINTNDSYKRIVMEVLFKNKMLNQLADAFAAQPIMKAKQTELEYRIKQLEEENAKERVVHEERREKQYAMIQEKDARLSELRQKFKDFERCRQQLTTYMEKYQTQIDINERITVENERRVKAVEADYDRIQDELTEATAQLEDLQTIYSALQSDFSLKNNELLRLKEILFQKEETARVDLMREFVTGVSEQFFYLTLFYLELRDTGKLRSESIELYADTLNNIDSVLERIGIKKIGVIDQKVSYDASIHLSTDAKIANGEQVVVSGYGWKIGDEVYIKVPVEKGK